MIFEELKNIRYGKKQLRQFGLLLMVIAGVVAWILYRKQSGGFLYAIICAVVLLGITLFYPAFFKVFYRIWMTIAIVMGWCMTMVIMIVLFYLVLTPIGIISRLCGKTFFPSRPDNSAKTYWNERSATEFTREYYEKQF